MNSDLIELYAHGGDKLSLSIRGLHRDDLLAVPDPGDKVGKWSIQQVVLHIADAEAVLVDRMKRIIAEENPTLLAFDENRWTNSLHYEAQSAEDAAAIFELTRRQVSSLLSRLPESALNRSGTHSERGKMTLADVVQFASTHLEHHLKFIHQKRARMGKEMW